MPAAWLEPGLFGPALRQVTILVQSLGDVACSTDVRTLYFVLVQGNAGPGYSLWVVYDTPFSVTRYVYLVRKAGATRRWSASATLRMVTIRAAPHGAY